MHPFIDLQPYNRDRRAGWARVLALAAVVSCAVLLGMGFGVLCALVNRVWFAALGAAIIGAGYLGARYLRK